ncbi:hypothetical protein O0L34_g2630 [Tuta absoluta]|nr:hypothetical protein O0L34_g2630 [Tuta absoluta]
MAMGSCLMRNSGSSSVRFGSDTRLSPAARHTRSVSVRAEKPTGRRRRRRRVAPRRITDTGRQVSTRARTRTDASSRPALPARRSPNVRVALSVAHVAFNQTDMVIDGLSTTRWIPK